MSRPDTLQRARLHGADHVLVGHHDDGKLGRLVDLVEGSKTPKAKPTGGSRSRLEAHAKELLCTENRKRSRRMVQYAGVDHFAMKTNDMEGTVRFYHDILGLKLVMAFKTGSEVVNKNVRHYFFDAGGGNFLAFFDGAKLPEEGMTQRFDHLALTVLSDEDFQAAYSRLTQHGVNVTDIVNLGGTRDPFGGKTFYFHDPNGIRMQIMLRTQPVRPYLTGDPDPVPSVRRILAESSGTKAEKKD